MTRSFFFNSKLGPFIGIVLGLIVSIVAIRASEESGIGHNSTMGRIYILIMTTFLPYIPGSGLNKQKTIIPKTYQYWFCDYTYLKPFDFTGVKQCQTFQFFPRDSWYLRVALLLFECFARYCYQSVWRCLYL